MNVYLYVLDTLADWEIGYITAEVNSGRYLQGKEIQLVFTGASERPVTTMGGVTIRPDVEVENLNPQAGDVLILPGADTWMNPEHRCVEGVARRVLEQGGFVAAICGATAALAAWGLLNDRRHTSNAVEYLCMVAPEYSGASLYVDEAAVCDRNLITASGLAALEFSHQLFRSTGIMEESIAEAWYQLYKTRKPEYFHQLMQAVSA